MLYPHLSSTCASLGFPLSEAQLQQFGEFEEALYRWNEQKNLTRIPREDCETRHFLESCLILGELVGPSLLDVGTGPGFPAWPIACVAPQLEVTAVDSNGKMLDFLRSVQLPNLTLVQARIEEVAWEEQFESVTGRAVAPLSIQLEISARPAVVGGKIIPFRSVSEEFDIPAARTLGLRLEKVHTCSLPDGSERAFPVYIKEKRTPQHYPRTWAMIKKKPL